MPFLQLFNIDAVREKLEIGIGNQSAVSFLVGKISIASDDLTKNKAGDNEIQKSRKRQSAAPAKQNSG